MPSNGQRITTHVLDIAAGLPAAGMMLSLSRESPDGTWHVLSRHRTGEDGRCAAPLPAAGHYELLFEVAAWRGGSAGFYETVPVRFRVVDPEAGHHVPLILSPFGYSTYRGG